ncbi:MAG TPA: DNA recombination protein RmuC [Acidimicrobiales bacterium]|nr:DNA recombination protein RmuC [Acidimicrobiales bacterium]
MVAVISAVVGVVVGVALTWAFMVKRSQALREDTLRAAADLKVRDSQLLEARERLERQRVEQETAMTQMGQTFKVLSTEALDETVQRFNQSQEATHKLRESKLDSTLKPLEDLLDEYKRNLADFNTLNAGALSDVKSKAAELLEAQQQTQYETRRLNQLLGRSSQRGAWGEIQLANVMNASRLRQGIDYELQVSATNDEGRSLRPDCVVNLPNGIRLAVDAKFPYDAFERSLDEEDGDLRRELQSKHARDLRSHVKTLREKSYWEAVSPAPEFVVCFIPSDFAMSAALDADPELLAFSAAERVVIVGPTNLLSLLWSVGFIVQQQQIAVNAEQIAENASQLFDRIRKVAEPVAKMGKSLDTVVRDYNTMLGSIEGRLLPAARRLRSFGGAQRAKDLPELATVDRLTTPLNEVTWGIDDENALPDGASEILELDIFDDE